MRFCKWCSVSGLTNPEGLCGSCRDKQTSLDLAKLLGVYAAERVDKVEWYDECNGGCVGRIRVSVPGQSYREWNQLVLTWNGIQALVEGSAAEPEELAYKVSLDTPSEDVFCEDGDYIHRW